MRNPEHHADDGGGDAPLRTQTAKAVLWNGLERWLVRGVTAITFVILGRVLGPADFGVVALATACTTFLAVVADLGFSTWLVQARDVGADEESTAFWTSTALATTAMVAVVVSADAIGALLGSDALPPVLRVLSVSLLISGVASTPTALLTRALRFRELAIREIVAAVTGSTVGVAVALATQSVWALVGQQLTQQVVACAALFVVSRWRPSARWSPKLAGDIGRFGIRMLSVTVLQQLRDQGEVLLLGRLLGPAALGYWVIARRLLEMVKYVSLAVISNVAVPAFMRVRDDRRRLVAAYESSLATSMAVVAPCMACLAVVSPTLITLVFGAQWREAVPIAVVLSLGAIISPMSYFDRAVLLARDRIDVELRLVLAVAVLHLLTVVVAGRHGLLPLAMATAARSYVVWPLRIGVLRRVVGIPYVAQGRATVVALTAALAVGVSWPVVALLGDRPPALTIVGGAMSYVAVYALLLYLTARSVVRDVASDLNDILPASWPARSSLLR